MATFIVRHVHQRIANRPIERERKHLAPKRVSAPQKFEDSAQPPGLDLLGDGIQGCVQTRAEAFKEWASICKADIHERYVCVDNDLARLDRVQRQIEAARKVVESSGRNDAEGDLRPDY